VAEPVSNSGLFALVEEERKRKAEEEEEERKRRSQEYDSPLFALVAEDRGDLPEGAGSRATRRRASESAQIPDQRSPEQMIEQLLGEPPETPTSHLEKRRKVSKKAEPSEKTAEEKQKEWWKKKKPALQNMIRERLGLPPKDAEAKEFGQRAAQEQIERSMQQVDMPTSMPAKETKHLEKRARISGEAVPSVAPTPEGQGPSDMDTLVSGVLQNIPGAMGMAGGAMRGFSEADPTGFSPFRSTTGEEPGPVDQMIGQMMEPFQYFVANGILKPTEATADFIAETIALDDDRPFSQRMKEDPFVTLAATGLSNAHSLATTIAATATMGPAGGMGAAWLQEYGAAYEEARKAGANDEMAQQAAQTTAMGNFLLEFLPVHGLSKLKGGLATSRAGKAAAKKLKEAGVAVELKPGYAKWLSAAVKQAAMEGTTEITQESWNILMAQAAYLDEQGLDWEELGKLVHDPKSWERVAEAGAAGFMLGGAVGLGQGARPAEMEAEGPPPGGAPVPLPGSQPPSVPDVIDVESRVVEDVNEALARITDGRAQSPQQAIEQLRAERGPLAGLEALQEDLLPEGEPEPEGGLETLTGEAPSPFDALEQAPGPPWDPNLEEGPQPGLDKSEVKARRRAAGSPWYNESRPLPKGRKPRGRFKPEDEADRLALLAEDDRPRDYYPPDDQGPPMPPQEIPPPEEPTGRQRMIPRGRDEEDSGVPFFGVEALAPTGFPAGRVEAGAEVLPEGVTAEQAAEYPEAVAEAGDPKAALEQLGADQDVLSAIDEAIGPPWDPDLTLGDVLQEVPFNVLTGMPIAKRPYKYVPLDVNDPDDIASRVWYHGTGHPDFRDLAMADPLAHADYGALFGAGLYQTDSSELGEEYYKLRSATFDLTKYRAQLQALGMTDEEIDAAIVKNSEEMGRFGAVLPGLLPSSVKLIDLEARLPDDAYAAFQEYYKELDWKVGGMTELPREATGSDLYNTLVQATTVRLSRDQADEAAVKDALAPLTLKLQGLLMNAGYHGYRHEGGNLVGGGKHKHNVVILWGDPWERYGKLAGGIDPQRGTMQGDPWGRGPSGGRTTPRGPAPTVDKGRARLVVEDPEIEEPLSITGRDVDENVQKIKGPPTGEVRPEHAVEMRRSSYEWEIQTPVNGENWLTTPVLIEAGDLLTSHNESDLSENPRYDQEMQQRNRTRAASKRQVTNIAQMGDAKRLTTGNVSNSGPPVIDNTGQVLDGNGRALGILRGYIEDTDASQAYRAAVIQEAADLELDATGMKEPVLARVLDLDRAEQLRYIDLANRQGGLKMGATERALADADRLTPEILGSYNPESGGDFTQSRNSAFVQKFMDTLEEEESADLMDSKGQLSMDGLRRIQAAVLAKAFPEPDVLERLLESTDNNIKGIATGLLASAPDTAKMRIQIEAGDLFDADLGTELGNVASKLAQLRDAGMNVRTYLDQEELTAKDLNEIELQLLEAFDRFKRSPKRIGELLTAYNNVLRDQGSPAQETLMPPPPPNKQKMLDSAFQRMGEVPQSELYSEQEAEAAEKGEKLTEAKVSKRDRLKQQQAEDAAKKSKILADKKAKREAKKKKPAAKTGEMDWNVPVSFMAAMQTVHKVASKGKTALSKAVAALTNPERVRQLAHFVARGQSGKPMPAGQPSAAESASEEMDTTLGELRQAVSENPSTNALDKKIANLIERLAEVNADLEAMAAPAEPAAPTAESTIVGAPDRSVETLALVGCCKPKLKVRAMAEDLYTSPLFKASMEEADAVADDAVILSAKHGLVSKQAVVEPYTQTLSKKAEKTRFREMIEAQVEELRAKYPNLKSVKLFAGKNYVEGFREAAQNAGLAVEVVDVLEGKQMGERLSYLKKQAVGRTKKKTRAEKRMTNRERAAADKLIGKTVTWKRGRKTERGTVEQIVELQDGALRAKVRTKADPKEGKGAYVETFVDIPRLEVVELTRAQQAAADVTAYVQGELAKEDLAPELKEMADRFGKKGGTSPAEIAEMKAKIEAELAAMRERGDEARAEAEGLSPEMQEQQTRFQQKDAKAKTPGKSKGLDEVYKGLRIKGSRRGHYVTVYDDFGNVVYVYTNVEQAKRRIDKEATRRARETKDPGLVRQTLIGILEQRGGWNTAATLQRMAKGQKLRLSTADVVDALSGIEDERLSSRTGPEGTREYQWDSTQPEPGQEGFLQIFRAESWRNWRKRHQKERFRTRRATPPPQSAELLDEARQPLEPSFWEKVKNALKSLYEVTTREYKYLRRNQARWMLARQGFNQIQAAREFAHDEIHREVKRIISGLTPEEVANFQEVSLLQSARAISAMNDEAAETPFGSTAEPVGLPMLLTEDDLYGEGSWGRELDEIVADNARLHKAIVDSRQLYKEIRIHLQEALREAGLGDRAAQLDRYGDDYMHHLVLLEEGKMREAGIVFSGEHLENPGRRRFYRKRTGKHKDVPISLRWATVQSKVMRDMMVDTEIARQLTVFNEHYNAMPRLRAQAQEKFDKWKENTLKPKLKAEQRKLEDDAAVLVEIAGNRKPTRDALGRMKLPKEYRESITSKTRRMAKAEMREAKRDRFNWQVEAEAEGMMETHDTWSPQLQAPMNDVYTISWWTATEALLNDQLGKEPETILNPEEIKKAKALGMVDTWFIPNELKDQLFHESGLLKLRGYQVLARAQGAWKEYTLFQPFGLAKYLIRNLIGDSLKTYTWQPQAILELPKAMKELAEYLLPETGVGGGMRNIGKRVAGLRDTQRRPSPWLRNWLRLGGARATIFTAELGRAEHKLIAGMADTEFKGLAGVASDMARHPVGSTLGRGYRGYMNRVGKVAFFFEAATRYAAYRAYLKQLKKNNGVPNKAIGYGGSYEAEIAGLKPSGVKKRETEIEQIQERIEEYRENQDLESVERAEKRIDTLKDEISDELDASLALKAYWLSNELVGAYDQVSVAGQRARESVVPFWSFQEANARTYFRMLRNLTNTMGLPSFIRGRVKEGAETFTDNLAFNVFGSVRYGMLVGGWYLALQALNDFVFRDEEEDLPDDVRRSMHLIFGRDADGRVRYFHRIGTFQELMNLTPLIATWPVWTEMMNGRLTPKQAINEHTSRYIAEQFNKLSPQYKLPIELFAKIQTYPRVTHSRKADSRWQVAFNAAGLGRVHNWIRGRYIPGPYHWERSQKMALDFFGNEFFYKMPDERNAYWETRDLVRDFNAFRGRDDPGMFERTKASLALANAREAAYYGDFDQAWASWADWVTIKQEQNPGWSADQLINSARQSLTNLDPLHEIAKDDRAAFYEWLPEGFEEDVDRGREYHRWLMATLDDLEWGVDDVVLGGLEPEEE